MSAEIIAAASAAGVVGWLSGYMAAWHRAKDDESIVARIGIAVRRMVDQSKFLPASMWVTYEADLIVGGVECHMTICRREDAGKTSDPEFAA